MIDHPSPEITHLMLDTPAFINSDRSDAASPLTIALSSLPNGITIIGGKLPGLIPSWYPYIDLLEDETYLSENAAITAECALSLISRNSKRAFRHSHILIIGWGRIAKHLAHLLHNYMADITIVSRSPIHRAEISSFGMKAINPDRLPPQPSYNFILNTAPAVLLPASFYSSQPHATIVDLASVPGISPEFSISARGLPNQMAPESSGELIAKTILRCIKEKSL